MRRLPRPAPAARRNPPTGGRILPALVSSLLLALPAGGRPPAAAADAPASAREPTGGGGSGGDDGRPVARDGAAGRQAARPSRSRPSRRAAYGPRRVPTPRGASLERARRLGVGSLRAVRRLLREPLPEPLRRAAAYHGRVGSTLRWPVDGGRFGRGFGFVRRSRPDLRHDGIDVGAPRGAVVRAVAPGIVIYSDHRLRGLGNTVVIAHPNGMVSLYAHQDRATVQPGWRVRRGERIGFVGDTGIARGPHLHFELRVDGRLVDPAPHFPPMTGGAHPGARVDGPDLTVDADGRIARVGGTPLGEAELVLDWLRRGAPPEFEEAIPGRVFSTWLWPARGGSPGRPFGDGHRGLDVEAPPGTPVRAAADGLVVYVGEELPGLGAAVVLAHPGAALTVYGGVDPVAVSVGDRVLRGEWLGRLGETAGEVEAPHLHFAAYRGGRPLDPSPDLRGTPEPPIR